jgi:lysophospholipase L1-like esterase
MPLGHLLVAQLLAFIVALGAFAVAAVACEGGGGGGKELTSLSTSLSGGGKEGETITVGEGTKVKDKATLTGKNASKATGKVTYKVYSEKECKTLVASAGEVTVSGESVPASSEEELEGGKAYYWQAHYGGDTNNDESTSPCTEILNVQANTTVSTKLSGEGKEAEELTILEGSKVKDKATLSGTNSSTATGKAVYKVYSEKECKTLVKESGEVTVTGGSIPASTEEELEGGRTYYWQAIYKGDTLHKESTSTCGKEVATVKASTALATTLSGESQEGATIEVLEGAKAIDKAALTGTNSSTAGGKVTYKVYSEKECKTLVAEAGEKTVTSGNVPASNEEELKAGTYYWQASYGGDSLHQESKSPCNEVLTVRTAMSLTTSLTTSLSGEGKEGGTIAVLEESAIKDKATLGGTNASKAGGTVTYGVYADPECKELAAEASTVTVSAGVVPSSSEEKLPPGTYYWQAVYSGDVLNRGSTSACGSETAVVTPKISTSLSGEGQSGEELEVKEETAVKDTVTLYGEHASTATGTVKYAVYSDKECKTLVTKAGEVTVAGGSVPASNEEKLKAGTYYWQAVYSGDEHNPAATSICGSEVDLVQTTTSLATSLSGESKSGKEIEVKEGAAAKDSATLSGTNAPTATGYVKYDVYSDSECKELVAEAGDVAVTSGTIPESNEETLPFGTYYWQAVYSGDGTNHGSTSACGSEKSVVTSTVTTSLSGESKSGAELEVEEAASVKDSATLHGEHVSTATGTVKYAIYSDSECTHLVKEAGEVTVVAGSVPASNEEKLSAGTYYWQASYSGDKEISAAKSACGTEVAIVKPANPQYAALGDSFSSGEGAGKYYAKTNTGFLAPVNNKCHRSSVAYPSRLAGALYPKRLPSVIEEKVVFEQQPPFIFRACSGAVAENLWGGGAVGGQYNEWLEGPNEWLTTPAQNLWVALPGGKLSTGPNNAITLVTLTIGGNDAGFATIAESCLDSDNDFLRGSYTPMRCKEVIEEWQGGVAKMPNTLQGRPGMPSIKTKLPVVLENIRKEAPNARIRIPLYPQILDSAHNGDINVDPPGAPPDGAHFFIDNMVPRAFFVASAIERFEDKLNQTIAATVQKWANEKKFNAKVIPGTVMSFNGHRLGDEPNQLWANGVRLPKSESFHPNCLGQIALANQVVANLGVVVSEKWGC